MFVVLACAGKQEVFDHAFFICFLPRVAMQPGATAADAVLHTCRPDDSSVPPYCIHHTLLVVLRLYYLLLSLYDSRTYEREKGKKVAGNMAERYKMRLFDMRVVSCVGGHDAFLPKKGSHLLLVPLSFFAKRPNHFMTQN